MPQIGFVSLGCPKALVDSQRILTQLQQDGYEIVGDYDAADAVVINTCGFIETAVAESMDAIDEALRENGKVIVTGCLGRDAQKIQDAYPGVLAVSGPAAYETVVSQVHASVPPPARDHRLDLVPLTGVQLTPRHYAYLKISEGCNHSCSFCIIPHLRGKLQSRSLDEVLEEAWQLKENGVRELLVISQDTSAYGSDLKYRTVFWRGAPVKSSFEGLCAGLSALGIWVRLHYVYPYPHVDRALPLMAAGNDLASAGRIETGLVPYLDMPLQHGDPRLLKLMRRPANAEKVLDRLRKWREQNSALVVRSTFITGFPGESDEDFETLLNFLTEADLDRVGCFPYSPIEGAAANELPDALPESVREERAELLMAHQSQISAQRLARRVGQRYRMLVDEVTACGDLLARSYAEAPEIDGVIEVSQHNPDFPQFDQIKAGDWVLADIVGASEHDLSARFVERL